MTTRLLPLCSLVFICTAVLAQQDSKETWIGPPEALVLDGIPRLPAALAEAAGRYAENRVAFPADWHPVRREMLIGTRFGNTFQTHLVKMPGGARQQLTFFNEPVYGGTFHPEGADYMVFSKDVGGGEWYQLFRYNLATGESQLLTDGKSKNDMGPWSTAGDRIAYASTRRTGKDTDLWVMNPADPKTDHLVTEVSGGGWAPLDWSPDDKRILMMEGISVNETYLWLVDAATGQKTELTPRKADEQVAYGSARFNRDGRGIYYTTDQGSEFKRLVYMDIASRQTRVLTQAIPWDVDEFALSWDGKKIALVANEDGLSTLHLLDAAAGKPLLAPKLPPGLIGGLRWHRNNRDLAFAFTSARNPVDCYSVDVTTNEMERWTTSETAVHTDAFADAELIRWKSFDGKTISGFLYRPPAKFTGKRPVLIEIHGGAGRTEPSGFSGSRQLLPE